MVPIYRFVTIVFTIIKSDCNVEERLKCVGMLKTIVYVNICCSCLFIQFVYGMKMDYFYTV